MEIKCIRLFLIKPDEKMEDIIVNGNSMHIAI